MPDESRGQAAVALIAFLAIALVLMAGVWGDPTNTWLGDRGDPYKFLDFFGWIPHAISSGQNPLFMNVIDAPRGVNLAWDTPMPLAALLVWPVTATLGVIAGYNVWLLIALTLDCWCSYLWLRRHTQSAIAAFAGGALILVGPYVSAHALGHPNLLSFFPMPLMFIAAERLIAAGSRGWRPALFLGALTACQFYLAEELVALAVIGIGTALLVAAVVYRAWLVQHLGALLPRFALAAGTFGALTAPYLAFQLFGPNGIHGLIQPYNFYVTNLENLVLPTNRTLAHIPAFTDAQAALWNGNAAEKTGYLGLPLIALAVYVVIRHWQRPMVRVVAIATGVALVLSLGPSLHVGKLNTGILLPSAVLGHVPLLENLLPSRLSLIVLFGFAYLLAVGVDGWLGGVRRRQIAVPVLAALSLLFLLPPGPAPASTAPVPRYFSSGGEARQLPADTVALVAPYIIDGASATAMLWQADADYRFSLTDGLAITAGPSGRPVFSLNTRLYRAFQGIQRHGILPPHTPEERDALTTELVRDQVSVIIVGPMTHRDQALELITWLTGEPPRSTQGVSVWTVSEPAG